MLSEELERQGLRYFDRGERSYFEVYARTVIHAISPQPARYKRILAASRKR